MNPLRLPLSLVGLLAAPCLAASPQAVISEFMAANQLTLEDEDGDDSDWIELHNLSGAQLAMGGWFLTDDAGDLSKWAIPANVGIPTGGYLVVYASGKNRAVAGSQLHTNFKLTAGGEYLALVKPDGVTVVSEYAPEYPEQFTDISYGLSPSAQERYFPLATPGAVNNAGWPAPVRVAHLPAEPADSDDLTVTAEAVGGLSAAGALNLHYRVGFGSEATLPMNDQGTGGDLFAGDGVHTGVIPASVAGPSDMLRYFVTADEPGSPAGRAPMYLDPLDSPQYFGVMIDDPAARNLLPVLHWFVEFPGAANTSNGTRCSLWHLGQLYDNVFVRRRGGSSLYWPKRSYKFDFNKGDHFRFDPGLGRVEEINLNSTYGDKAFLRQPLSYEVYADAGVPGSLSYPMRLQQNGAFFSVAAFIEQVDQEFLERHELDPDGALYKMFNEATSSAWGVQKKTREWEGNQDLGDLIGGIQLNGAALRDFLFDNVDVPEVISYIAATTLIHDNDHVAKNYYLYRDSDGDGEWRMLPWDKDLTFGRNYTLQGGVTNDTIWADDDPYSHPLFADRNHRKNDGPWNRLIDAMHRTPEIQALYLRRLRTLMGELLQAPGTPASALVLEQRIDQLQAQMAADVALDQAKWGVPNYGNTGYDFATALGRLKDLYLAVRRTHLFVTHGANGIIPDRQSAAIRVAFGRIEDNPVSGNQEEEFIELLNSSAEAADVSGWTLNGGVDFVFPGGAVIPAGGSVYAAENPAAFRLRASGPSGGQSLLVVGPYSGNINPGETLALWDRGGALVAATDGPVLLARDLVAGATASFVVAGAAPAALQHLAYSLTGPGPTSTSYGLAALSPPIRLVGSQAADWAGTAVFLVTVPAAAAGVAVWAQAYDQGSLEFTNGLALTVG
ncbi:MAG: CotH kinase family protein [Planctomycetes bacterium]|nr:CotH kinase family protein [Planctomycetota bacterium]